MSRYLKRWMKRHPFEVFLYLFNTGIFAWLMVTTRLILSRLGLHSLPVLEQLPSWILSMGNYSLAPMRGLVGQLPWLWLAISFMLTLLVTFLKGVVRRILGMIILALGLYLLFKHWELLQWLLS
ncbi:hypothetical protein ACMZ6Y_02625 [Streptococcus pluranimalium]|uniref:hypothetical protein n=1 Tax=Streptococcus hyovaginalis TaxID=149015 RepID=UPI0014793284|nr:hypothetical protein [Streptococcus hyovaginalis]